MEVSDIELSSLSVIVHMPLQILYSKKHFMQNSELVVIRSLATREVLLFYVLFSRSIATQLHAQDKSCAIVHKYTLYMPSVLVWCIFQPDRAILRQCIAASLVLLVGKVIACMNFLEMSHYLQKGCKLSTEAVKHCESN